MKNQCEKIGIDCEWCENKSKCLIKSFYKDILFEADICNVTIENKAKEIFNKLSEKIKSKKDFTVQEYYGKKYISVDIWREKINEIHKITSENKLQSIDISLSIFNRVKELLYKEFEFKELCLIHKSITSNITQKVKTFLYFIP